MQIKYFDEKPTLKNTNMFIGISIGALKPLTQKTAKEYLEWSLKSTNGSIAILIADEIAKYNYEIFSSYNKSKSLKRAQREGEKYYTFFSEIITKLPNKSKNRIKLLKWKDIWTKKLEKSRKIIEEEYLTNQTFQKEINKFLENYAHNRRKKLDNDKKRYLSNYILYELPTLLFGIEFKNKKYKILFYPTFKKSTMSEFVLDIVNGKKFKKLKKKLNINETITLIETYLEIPGKNQEISEFSNLEI